MHLLILGQQGKQSPTRKYLNISIEVRSYAYLRLYAFYECIVCYLFLNWLCYKKESLKKPITRMGKFSETSLIFIPAHFTLQTPLLDLQVVLIVE